MAGDKLVPKKLSEFTKITDPTGCTFAGFKTDEGDIQIDFKDMTPLFGISQIKGQDITKAPSLKLFTDASDNLEKSVLLNNTLNFTIKKSILRLNGTTTSDVSWSKYSVSDLIPIYALKGCTIKGLLAWKAAQAYPIAFFAEDKTIIGQAYTNIDVSIETKTDIVISDELLANYPNVAYARLGTNSDFVLTITNVNDGRLLSGLKTEITSETSAKLLKKEDIILLSSAMFNSDGVEFADKTGWDMGKSPFLDGNGIYRYYPTALGWFYVTKYIPVKGIKKIHYSGRAENNVSAIVEYDKDLNILKVHAGTTGAVITELDVELQPNTVFVRCSGDVRYPLHLSLIGSTYKEAVRNILEEVSRSVIENKFLVSLVDNSIQKSIDDNPLAVITETAGLTSIFHDWGFLGDSLMSGANQKQKPDGSWVFYAQYAHSWCQRLCAMIGQCKGTNFSVAGFTTTSWIDKYWNHEANGVTIDGTESKFKTDKKTGYILGLATNDASANHTVGNFDTDVDLQNFNNNANTFIGEYAGIIQRTKSVQPSAKIFVITIPAYWSSSAETKGYNSAIRLMPQKFSNVYLIDLQKYSPDNFIFRANYYKNGHMNTQGYQYVAYMIASYIDYIIRNNPAEFQDVSLIGTPFDN